MICTIEPARLNAIVLAREGYGTVTEILAQPVDIVLDTLAYARFTKDYEAAHAELNK